MQTNIIGICTNLGGCNNALTKIPIEVSIFSDFHCPECGHTLVVKENKKIFSIRKLRIFAISLSLLLSSIAVYFLFDFFNNNKKQTNISLNQSETVIPIEIDSEVAIREIIKNDSTILDDKEILTDGNLNNLDEKNRAKIENLLLAEDKRDLNAILVNFSDNLEQYWNLNKPTRLQLERTYTSRWKKQSQSQNISKKIVKIDDSTFELNNDYTYTNRKTGKVKTVSSIIEFKFNIDGKIKSIIGKQL